MTRNLLEETKALMKDHGKQAKDVSFIGSLKSNYTCTWRDFTFLANFDYDGGFGLPEVPTDLIIVFTDGSWLERHEHDGAEWWEFNKAPSFPDNPEKITRLKGGFWRDLKEIHEEYKEEEANHD